MIDNTTSEMIKGYLEGFIQGMIDEHKDSTLDPRKLRPTKDFSKDGRIKPFHEALLLDGILRINEFERSFSTKLGSTFEEVAKMIGKNSYKKSERGLTIEGNIPRDAISTIERIIDDTGTNGMKVSYLDLVDEVVNASIDNKQKRSRIADLYLMDENENEIIFEIKSPKPNKGQCLEATDRLLQIHAIKRLNAPRLKTFYAMAYNPYGNDKSDFKHSFVLRYMDMENQILIGKEFWDLVGGEGTYEEVLEIYREVGREKGPELIDQLAFNY
jgi:hypothetical protein